MSFNFELMMNIQNINMYVHVFSCWHQQTLACSVSVFMVLSQKPREGPLEMRPVIWSQAHVT